VLRTTIAVNSSTCACSPGDRRTNRQRPLRKPLDEYRLESKADVGRHIRPPRTATSPNTPRWRRYLRSSDSRSVYDWHYGAKPATNATETVFPQRLDSRRESSTWPILSENWERRIGAGSPRPAPTWACHRFDWQSEHQEPPRSFTTVGPRSGPSAPRSRGGSRSERDWSAERNGRHQPGLSRGRICPRANSDFSERPTAAAAALLSPSVQMYQSARALHLKSDLHLKSEGCT
jgi:hypothetical protein